MKKGDTTKRKTRHYKKISKFQREALIKMMTGPMKHKIREIAELLDIMPNRANDIMRDHYFTGNFIKPEGEKAAAVLAKIVPRDVCVNEWGEAQAPHEVSDEPVMPMKRLRSHLNSLAIREWNHAKSAAATLSQPD